MTPAEVHALIHYLHDLYPEPKQFRVPHAIVEQLFWVPTLAPYALATAREAVELWVYAKGATVGPRLHDIERCCTLVSGLRCIRNEEVRRVVQADALQLIREGPGIIRKA